MKKITRYSDIPQFTQSGQWECDYPLHSLVRFVEEQVAESELNLDPDFRRGHVWNEAQQIAWLEFFMRGGKTGRVLYFNAPWWGRRASDKGEFVIVDGKQRLTAIMRFINNEIPVFGSYHREFADSIRLTNTMRVNVNDLATRAEVLQWYIEFNSGGVVHSPEEIERVKKLLDAEKKLAKRKLPV